MGKSRILRTVGSPFLTAAFFLSCIWCVPEVSFGHSLYVQSSRYHVNNGKQSPLFFCYGHRVPVDDGLSGKKLKSLRIHNPAGEAREMEVRDETGLHSYMVEYDKPGTWALSAETNPGYYTVFIDEKGAERHAIKPKSAVLDKAKEIKTSLLSKQYTKTYVVCETQSGEFPSRIGLPLELVPAKDVFELKAGEDLELKIYFNGKPYTGKGTWDATYSGFSTESEDNFHPATEISGDTIRIPVPNTGRWFVRYSIKIEAEGEDLKDYTHMKHTSTMVFQIPNERKGPEKD